jgi:hypothetical protein
LDEVKVSSPNDQNRIKVIQEYFRLADQGRPEVLELFHEDAELYFPKFGFGVGRQSLFEMFKGFEGSLEFIQHDYDKLTFIPAGDYVVVEGTSHGRLSGRAWTGGETPGGRFCNVFRFGGDRISSLHIYLDPDYTGGMPRDLDGARIVNGKRFDLLGCRRPRHARLNARPADYYFSRRSRLTKETPPIIRTRSEAKGPPVSA